MRRTILRTVIVAGLIAGAVVLWNYAGDNESRALSTRPWSPEECLEYVAGPDPMLRSYAIDDLLRAGEPAVAALQRQARMNDEQRRDLCMELLTEFFYVDDTAVIGAAVDALLELREDAAPEVAAEARRRLLTHQDQISTSCRKGLVDAGAFVHQYPVIPGAQSPQVSGSIVFGPQWNGGRVELQWIRRMPRTPRIYLVDGDEIDTQDVEWLRSIRDDIIIQRRGRACLGIVFRDGLRVHAVTPDSPADIAGVRPTSMLLQIDGDAVTTFEDLVDVMVDRQPGETVHLTFRTQGEVEVVSLRLGTDIETGNCACKPESSPIRSDVPEQSS